MMRRLLWVVLVLACLIVLAPYLPAKLFQPSIARALERGLGRKVEVGEVRLSLLGMPGFTVDDVTIHEDVRAGIEPFAYVQTLGASVSLAGLLHRKLDFSTINLGDASINVVKTGAGPWNFQYLLGGTADSASLPAIKMRGGRVNFKFGDTKSVFYFDDADLSVAPNADGTVEVRFGGAPARTDRRAQNFGHFFVRGNWTPGGNPQLDLKVELEPTSLDEVLRLADPRGYGVHGVIAMNAQVTGPTSQLDVDGEMQLSDLHRWDLLPEKTGGWKQRYKGTLDLRAEKLTLATVADSPNPQLRVELNGENYSSTPLWETAVQVNEIPLSTVVEVARHMGAPFPAMLTAEGPMSGSLFYSSATGLTGEMSVDAPSVHLPGAPDLHAKALTVGLKDGVTKLEPASVEIGEASEPEAEPNKVQLEASYTAQKGLDLKLATRALSVADTRSFGLKAIPLLEHAEQGTWRGSAHYSEGEWTGEYDLLNSKVTVDGLAEPLTIQFAAVSLTPARAVASRLRASAGAIPFSGEYRWEPAAARPHKFKLRMGDADLAEWNRVLAPAFVRQAGLLETFRIGETALPDWLKARHAEGTISVDSLKVQDKILRVQQAHVIWDEASVRLEDIDAHIEDSPLAGLLTVDLAAKAPAFRFTGTLEDVPYRGGRVDFEGSVDAAGTGPALLLNARGQGSLKGRALSFAPEGDFRTVTAQFVFQGGAWKFSNLEMVQGADTLTGTAVSGSDGKLVLDLTGRGKQVHFAGPLVAAGVQ
jgi:hypothetical protein